MAVIDVRGDIIPNDTKWIYDWLEWDSTCPNDIRNALAEKEEGETLTVLINSGGGSVMAGQIAGLVSKEQSCREIIDEIIQEAYRTLREITLKYMR